MNWVWKSVFIYFYSCVASAGFAAGPLRSASSKKIDGVQIQRQQGQVAIRPHLAGAFAVQQQQSNPTSHVVTTAPQGSSSALGGLDSSYKYNSKLHQCVDANGKAGWNMGTWVECGRFDSVQIQGKDFSGQNLKGLILNGVGLSQVQFDGADLEGALLLVTTFQQVSFKKTNLVDATVSAPSESMTDLDLFRGARLNYKTYLDFKDQEQSLPPDSQYVSTASSKLMAQFQWGDQFSSGAQKAFVQDDLARLARNELNAQATSISQFDRIFGTTHPQGALGYFIRRIQFLDAFRVENKTTRAANFSVSIFTDSFFRSVVNLSNDLRQNLDLLAAPFWSQRSPVQLQDVPAEKNDLLFRGHYQRQSSMGRSMMKFSQNYFGNVGWIDRLGMLVHEARHSDCYVKADKALEFKSAEAEYLSFKKGPTQALISAQDYNLYMNKYIASQQRLDKAYHAVTESNTCGQVHIRCPMDLKKSDGSLSLFAGAEGACDENIWGSYGVQAIYLKGLLEACQNCSEENKQYISTIAADMLLRVSDLSELNLKTKSPELRGDLVPVPRSQIILQGLGQ